MAEPHPTDTGAQPGDTPQFSSPSPTAQAQLAGHPTGTVPSNTTSGKTQATGLNTESLIRVFTSLQGILRVVEWFFAVIAFGAMADQTGYDTQDSLKYLVAVCVMTWMRPWFLSPSYIFDLHSKYPALNLVEFVADVFFAFMDMIAGIAVAAFCNEKISIPGGSVKKCENADKPKAAAAFAFLLAFTLIVSAYLSFRKYKAAGR